MTETTLITTIFLISGLLSLLHFLRLLLYHVFAISKWPDVTGEIIEFKYAYLLAKDPDFDGWNRKVQYKYILENVTYYGSKISNNIILTANDKKQAEYWYDNKYSIGQKVNVYYNPRDYYESVLVNTFGFLNYIPLAFGLVCFWAVYLYS